VDGLHICSPAKINLFLEVIARRPDGYHEIETAMQVVDLCDRVHLSRIPRGIEINVSGEEVPTGQDNLAYRAAALLAESAGLRGGVRIGLEKRIPVSGGLGGGSSNAAAVLAGLNRLYGLLYPREALQNLAARLGSDVPFFLSDGLTLATGRGEVLMPISASWSREWVVIANPRVPVSTAWVYREASSKLTEWGPRASIKPLIATGALAWPPTWAFNRLEAVVMPHRPEVRALKDLLEAGGGRPALMSGSGGSVFAVVPDAATGEVLVARVRAGGGFATLVTTLPNNPILTATE
jgi:4-diphosphocytidyl-2-C-methyl-D-erythritol kinase